MKPDLLKGIRIVDFTTYVAAPGAGRIMADWGADVIKVEGLTGDPMRSFGLQMGIPANDDVNPIWELENGNKRGITLDLKNPKGMEVMMKLLESADGMTTNVRLGSLKKMGLDYETLAPLPRYCATTFPGIRAGYIPRDFPCRRFIEIKFSTLPAFHVPIVLSVINTRRSPL